jgi:hypothetical protein
MKDAKQAPEMTPIEVGPKLIEAMIKTGYLSPRRRSDHLAIIRATQTMVGDLVNGALPAPVNPKARRPFSDIAKTRAFFRRHPPSPAQLGKALTKVLEEILAIPRH